MTHARLLRFDVEDETHGRVPCAALVPDPQQTKPLRACLFLYGGGGSRESLGSLQQVIEAAWTQGTLTACIVATPDVGPWSFYLEDRARGYAWESFITERFVPRVQALTSEAARPLGVMGVSMGGYAALKLAFQHPQHFAAVSAVSPMLEPYPAGNPNQVPLRNRYFYPPEVPVALLGAQRDEALYRADHPVARARKHAATIIAHHLAIYIDAAGQDAFHAQDGAESLHRELWTQDIPHEYHLRRDSDHAGPDLAARLITALEWTSARLQPRAAEKLSATEEAWRKWLDHPEGQEPSTPLPPQSSLIPSYLRYQSRPRREAAAEQDPSIHRHYGLL